MGQITDATASRCLNHQRCNWYVQYCNQIMFKSWPIHVFQLLAITYSQLLSIPMKLWQVTRWQHFWNVWQESTHCSSNGAFVSTRLRFSRWRSDTGDKRGCSNAQLNSWTVEHIDHWFDLWNTSRYLWNASPQPSAMCIYMSKMVHGFPHLAIQQVIIFQSNIRFQATVHSAKGHSIQVQSRQQLPTTTVCHPLSHSDRRWRFHSMKPSLLCFWCCLWM